MSKYFTLYLAALVASVGIVSVSTDEPDDPIVASFERALEHEPAPAKKVTREAISDDILYTLVSMPLQSADTSDAATAVAKGEND